MSLIAENPLINEFTDKRNGVPLVAFQVNESFKIGVYSGTKSALDIIVRYRQKRASDGTWTRVRTPKHIHWVIDVMIKMDAERNLTRQFLDFLIEIWGRTDKMHNREELDAALDLQSLSQQCSEDFARFEPLSKHGEYSVKFLILVAILLMKQERTNYENTQLFSTLFQKLTGEGDDIFGIVSAASFRG